LIFVSAMQYKYAGRKLPTNPESATNTRFSLGIFLNATHAKGSNTIAALDMRIDATCIAVSACIPSFISMKELPQIIDSAINNIQPEKLFFNFQNFGKGLYLKQQKIPLPGFKEIMIFVRSIFVTLVYLFTILKPTLWDL